MTYSVGGTISTIARGEWPTLRKTRSSLGGPRQPTGRQEDGKVRRGRETVIIVSLNQMKASIRKIYGDCARTNRRLNDQTLKLLHGQWLQTQDTPDTHQSL